MHAPSTSPPRSWRRGLSFSLSSSPSRRCARRRMTLRMAARCPRRLRWIAWISLALAVVSGAVVARSHRGIDERASRRGRVFAGRAVDGAVADRFRQRLARPLRLGLRSRRRVRSFPVGARRQIGLAQGSGSDFGRSARRQLGLGRPRHRRPRHRRHRPSGRRCLASDRRGGLGRRARSARAVAGR